MQLALDGLPPILAFAAFGELLLNRILSRATIFIPKGPTAEAFLSALAFLGFFLLAFAFLLSVVWLVAFAARSLSTVRAGARELLLALLLFFFLLLGTATVVEASPLATLVFAATFIAILLVLLVEVWGGPLIWRAFVAGVSAAYLLHTLAIAASAVASLAPSLAVGGASEGFQRAGEVAALLAAPLLFVAAVRTARGTWVMNLRRATIAAIPAAILVFLASLSLSILASISLWSLGFTLFLPYPLYAAGLWLFGVAVLSARRRAPANWIALPLLFTAGYNLNLSYLYFLAVIALILMIPLGRRLSSEASRDTNRSAPSRDETP